MTKTTACNSWDMALDSSSLGSWCHALHIPRAAPLGCALLPWRLHILCGAILCGLQPLRLYLHLGRSLARTQHTVRSQPPHKHYGLFATPGVSIGVRWDMSVLQRALCLWRSSAHGLSLIHSR